MSSVFVGSQQVVVNFTLNSNNQPQNFTFNGQPGDDMNVVCPGLANGSTESILFLLSPSAPAGWAITSVNVSASTGGTAWGGSGQSAFLLIDVNSNTTAGATAQEFPFTITVAQASSCTTNGTSTDPDIQNEAPPT